MSNNIPDTLERELHPLCNRSTVLRTLEILGSRRAVCIQEVARDLGCSEITARKNLNRIKRAGLAVEIKIGKARVFIKTNSQPERTGDLLPPGGGRV